MGSDVIRWGQVGQVVTSGVSSLTWWGGIGLQLWALPGAVNTNVSLLHPM